MENNIIAHRNIDLMHHATLRRNAGEPAMSLLPASRTSRLVWDDFNITGLTPTRLRQTALGRCTSVTIQIGYQFTAVPSGAPWPIVTIRDGSVASNTPLTAVNGIELIPGDMLSMSRDEDEIANEVFIDPTELWAFLNATLVARLHICYGVLL